MENARLHDGRKDAWEELRWDQDVGRWIGPRRDERPPHARQP
jgi:hypothetical protein